MCAVSLNAHSHAKRGPLEPSKSGRVNGLHPVRAQGLQQSLPWCPSLLRSIQCQCLSLCLACLCWCSRCSLCLCLLCLWLCQLCLRLQAGEAKSQVPLGESSRWSRASGRYSGGLGGFAAQLQNSCVPNLQQTWSEPLTPVKHLAPLASDIVASLHCTLRGSHTGALHHPNRGNRP